MRYFLATGKGGSSWMEHSLRESERERRQYGRKSDSSRRTVPVPSYNAATRLSMALTPTAYCRSLRSRRNARVETLITPYPHIDQCRSWITSTDTFEYSSRTFTPSSRPLHSNSSCSNSSCSTQPNLASFHHYLRSNNHAIDSINSFTYFLLASICGIINQNPCGKPGYTFIFVGIPYSVRNTFS